MKRIFISAGDVSGDFHASYLVRALYKEYKDIDITAIGGENLKEVVPNFLENIVNIEGFGIGALFQKYFKFKKIFKNIVKPAIVKGVINAVILVDFYGFNIHIAKLAHLLGIKVIYYISPQIWASRKHRINKLKKYVDKMIVIFEFEEKIYRDAGIKVSWIGHPLLDIIETGKTREEVCCDLKVKSADTLIGLLPGSREQEILKILPIMLNVFKKYEFLNTYIVLFVFNQDSLNLVEEIINKYSFRDNIKLVIGSNYDIRKEMKFCLSCSGTVTIENLILSVPMIVMYKISKLSYYIAKLIVKVKYIAMPNILANHEIVPEYVQKIDENKLKNNVFKYLNSDLTDIREKLSNIKKILGTQGILNRARTAILEEIGS